MGQSLHEFECSWLKAHSKIIQHEMGEYDFSMLWLVVRILAQRHLETRLEEACKDSMQELVQENESEYFKHSWDEICRLRANQELISPEKVRHWTVLAESYLGHDSTLPVLMSTAAMVDLICKEEMNAFCLYPKSYW